jgi:large subunit ribosomal protein L32
MPEPKKRHSRGRKLRRRSHHALKITQLAKCTNCNAAVMPHKVCMNCGFYKGKKILDITKNRTVV